MIAGGSLSRARHEDLGKGGSEKGGEGGQQFYTTNMRKDSLSQTSAYFDCYSDLRINNWEPFKTGYSLPYRHFEVPRSAGIPADGDGNDRLSWNNRSHLQFKRDSKGPKIRRRRCSQWKKETCIRIGNWKELSDNSK